MATTPVNALTNVGSIADNDKLVGERVDGTTVRVTFNGVVYDSDFSTNGVMVRTSSANYANRVLTGTSNRLDITNGDGISGNPAFDISSTYVGQNTITTLGTIGTGTWQGTAVGVAFGGTGRATATAYAPVFGGTTATGAHQSGTAGTSGQLLQSGGAAAVAGWTTATFAATYGASQLLYSNGSNTVTGLTTANSGVLITSGAGVPSIATDIPTSVTIGGGSIYRAGGTDVAVADGGTNLSSYTQGDIIYASGATTLATLAKDANATRYLSNQGTSNNPSWNQITLTNGVTGVLPVANGGTNASSASITAFNNITGYTAAGATGTTSTNLVFSTSPTITTANLVGTATNNNAAAGSVGEVIESQILAASAVALTTSTTANITSISLTAGDWVVWGNFNLTPAGASSISFQSAGITSTSATLPTRPASGAITWQTLAMGGGAVNDGPVGMVRFSLASTTTIYLVIQVAWTTSTMAAYGYLGARRTR